LVGHVDLRLPVSSVAPRAARRELGIVAIPLEAELRELVALLVSELVTNSVQHAAATTESIALKAWVLPTAARVTVGDGGSGFHREVRPVGPSEEGGRGLWLVDSLADAWGICRDGRNWSWFELHGPVASPLGPFVEAVAHWSLRSKDAAWSMATSLGPPDHISARRLGWTTQAGDVVAMVCADSSGEDGPRSRHGLRQDRAGGRWWLESFRGPRHSLRAQASREASTLGQDDAPASQVRQNPGAPPDPLEPSQSRDVTPTGQLDGASPPSA
jgi:anti-sigma regulatory factor (Ser/Thr protein kinase)